MHIIFTHNLEVNLVGRFTNVPQGSDTMSGVSVNTHLLSTYAYMYRCKLQDTWLLQGDKLLQYTQYIL